MELMGLFFDLLFLRPKPIDGPCPPPPEPFHLEVDDSYTKCPGTEFLGAVYDQDTNNLLSQTKGFKSSFKKCKIIIQNSYMTIMEQ